MIKQSCAICGQKAPRKILYKQNFSINQINENIFSARRLPDGIHYQILKCLKCGLVFSSPILSEATLKKLYKESRVTYGGQIADLTKTYGSYLRELEKYGVGKEELLEIGCGDGFFLVEAKRQNYREVYGVEPSYEAIEKAPKEIRKNIKAGFFKNGLFPKNFFDVVCFFQTFDHISDPNKFLKNCWEILKPGGLILAFNHNAASFQAKVLGEKSPIIDIEHTYLYNPKTMRMIFEKNNFQVVKLAPSFNIYSLDYLLHLAPLPGIVRKFSLSVLDFLGVLKLKFKLRIGNMVLFAKKQ
jgi:SAM-dependent methyltransferase